MLLLVPVGAFCGISGWGYLPFISYTGEYPGEVIKQGRNSDLLQNLWNKPQSFHELQYSGFDFEDVDTITLQREGMIYNRNEIYYSAIPFIDSLATNHLRDKAKSLAKSIVEDTQEEMDVFFNVLNSKSCKESAFPLVHSLVFDDIIWNYLNVSKENTTICPADSMSWTGLFYFCRPEHSYNYGTNGMRLGDNYKFKFAWGDNSNAYLCTVFIKSQILKALRCMLDGDEPSEEMIQDCIKFGVIDEENNLTIPILDGKDEISVAADKLARAAADSFALHFDGMEVADIIGWNCEYNEAALKVILYHETMSQISKLLDETGLLPIPEILKSEIPVDKKQTASVAYITLR